MLKGYPSVAALWGIVLLTGGFLKATRGPSCAAAADKSVTFGQFVAIHATWVSGSGR